MDQSAVGRPIKERSVGHGEGGHDYAALAEESFCDETFELVDPLSWEWRFLVIGGSERAVEDRDLEGFFSKCFVSEGDSFTFGETQAP